MLEFMTAGESHGKGLTAVVAGIPSGLKVDVEVINRELRRRQSGYGRGGRMKIEKDRLEILSGVRFGRTLGSPVTFWIENRDWANWQVPMSIEEREVSTQERRQVTRPRPGHADLAGALKYNARDLRDILERSSARETAARVAVGALARLFLREFGIEIASHTLSVGEVALPEEFPRSFEKLRLISEDPEIRCLDGETGRRMIEAIKTVHLAGDTIGGSFEVVAHRVIPGLGSHISWNKRLDGRLAQAVMSIPAVKAVEIGAGILTGRTPGSRVHDEIFYSLESGFWRTSNNAGGMEGGITNGEDVLVRGHIKPIPTLRKPLKSVEINTKEPFEAAYERSDTCVVPAAGVVGEAMVAIVLADAFLEKFGGDSLEEVRRNCEGYREQLRRF